MGPVHRAPRHCGTREPWWRTAVVYQVDPRGVTDPGSCGSGLNGIRRRLRDLARLQIDAVGLRPAVGSAGSSSTGWAFEHRDIDPAVGTLADFEALVREAHEADLRVVIDVVTTHTSERHPWFRAALAADPNSRARDRFIFRDGRGPAGALPPTAWETERGARAWSRVPDGQWYLHLTGPGQPDLDWTNNEVVREYRDILRCWLDRGVDGLRIDVAQGVARDPDLVEREAHPPPHRPRVSRSRPSWDFSGLPEVYRGWRTLVEECAADQVLLAAAWSPAPEQLARFLRIDALHAGLVVSLRHTPWDADQVRAVIQRTRDQLEPAGAPAIWAVAGDEGVEHPGPHGDGVVGRARAGATDLLMLALPGMVYVHRIEPETGRILDGAPASRADDGGRSAPDADHCALDLGITASALVARRRFLGDSPMVWLDDAPAGVLAFRRGQDFACVTNYRDHPVELPGRVASGKAILLSGDQTGRVLRPNSTGWYLMTRRADDEDRIGAKRSAAV